MTTDCYHTELHFQGEPPRRRGTDQRRASLPLFAWAEAHTSQTLPMAVRYVRRLTGASPSTARLYAELAGFSMTGEEGNV